MSHIPDTYLRSLVSPEVEVGNVVKELAQALLDEREEYAKLIDAYDQAQIEIAFYQDRLDGGES